MNFVTQLEDYLRDLGSEARKKHPGVKEASERAILKLRTLQNQYVSAVRKASNDGEKHPDTTLFRSSDLLHPFLLAANYPNASSKLLDTSFKAMKLLMEADAICPGDGMNMVRVWMIQAQVVANNTKDSNQPGLGGIGGGLAGDGGNSSGGGGKLASISNAVTSASTALAGAASTATSSKDTTTSPSDSSPTTTANSTDQTSASSSSWFGGYFGGSNAATSSSSAATSTATAEKRTSVVTAKSAVSSSHGQAGTGHLNAKDLEKIALDILSCILQLLELKDLPVSNEQWIQSVTICCLLYMPLRHNVRQAAHSTLPQVLTLLVKAEEATQLTMKTWDDLLACALGFSSSTRKSSGNVSSTLHGAFGHCRIGEKDSAQPPSPALSLELMATLLTESPDVVSGVGQKTFGVIVQVLQNQSKINSNAFPLEYLRALQFALIVLQTQGNDWPAECRELIGRLIQPIALATEAIRKQADFEDGFVYKVPNKQIPTTSSSSTKIETLQGLPSTVLWKAALSMETVKSLVQEKSNKELWLHEEVVGHLLEATSDFCTIGASCEDHMNLLVRACRVQGESSTSLAYSAETLDSIERWKKGKANSDSYVLGEALWAGLMALLKMIDQLEESVLEQSFAPSLSVLQHYLKRFPANGILVQRSLEGYFSLAKVSLNVPLLRGALMASLCKLSLPHWGSNDPSTLLKDHNIAALICLLNVIHRYHDKLGSEWSIVLQTFEELSCMSIASPELSDSAYVGALSISAVYSRFCSFSACLSDASLVHFLSGLKQVAIAEKSPVAIPSPVGGAAIRRADTSNDNGDEKSGIGNKIMNMGARAMTWNNDGSAQQDDVPVAERTKNKYYDEYRAKFTNRLESSRHPIRNNEVSFSNALLADAAMSNAFRHGRSGSEIFETLCSSAMESTSSRLFFMDIVATMIISHVAEEDSIPVAFTGPTKVLYSDPRQNEYLAVNKESSSNGSAEEAISHIDLLRPLCKLIATAESAEIAEVGLEALYSILESTGHKLQTNAWKQVIDAIACVPAAEHSAQEWTDSCQLGFRCLKLIVDDFLEDAASAARSALLDCCSTFGSSHHDVNTSLTSIGLLWSIADQDAGTKSVERALAELVRLSGDRRPEVRNCSVNTLFSCIVGRGPTFSESQWESCICSTIFGVYDVVTNDTDGSIGTTAASSNKKQSRYQVSVHHSRDSADKQWLTTQALVLRGLSRLLRNFFNSLLKTTDNATVAARGEDDTPWFDKAWNKLLGFAYDASIQAGGRDTLDLRNAGVELMALCNQLACAAGAQAAITPARVGTNMEVVNGALRSVRTPERAENEATLHHSHSAVTEMWRENMFLDAFDVLDSYREHLDSNDLDEIEATQVQVLSNLAAELAKLYDCCKDHEFKEDPTLSSLASFEDLLVPTVSQPLEGDAMVLRFVRIVSTVATASYSGPGSRFVSQAQRSCMDVLKTMAANGSPEAIMNLASFADSTFFAEQDSGGKPKKGVDILEHEATNTLVGVMSYPEISDECKVLALARLLSIFLETDLAKAKKKTAKDFDGVSYKNLIPVLKVGISSAKELEENRPQSDSAAITGLLNGVWKKVFLSLTQMLSPMMNESKRAVIVHSPDLVLLIRDASASVPERFSSDLDSILGSGATRCLEIAKATDLSAEKENDTLDLFGACFAGACKSDKTMQEMGKSLFEGCYNSLSTKPPEIDMNVKATLSICKAMQQADGMEDAVIVVFAELSSLIGLEDIGVRKAAAAVLAKADIGQVLDDRQALCEAAEGRARVAEGRVTELEAEVELLNKQKEALERQLGLL